MNKTKFFVFFSMLFFLAPLSRAEITSACTKNKECVLLPKEEGSCFPCQKGLTDYQAVHGSSVKTILEPRKEACQAQFKEMRKQKVKPEPPKCENDYRKAVCVDGTCQPAALTEKDKAKFEKWRKKMMERKQGSEQGNQ